MEPGDDISKSKKLNYEIDLNEFYWKLDKQFTRKRFNRKVLESLKLGFEIGPVTILL